MTEPITQSSHGISGSTLKIIAIVTMLLDHIGASLVQPLLTNAASAQGVTSYTTVSLIAACPDLAIPYYTLRYIGRIAFPIFCFLLVEGFLHTKSLSKYALRLAVFALVSEIPFDLAFHRTLVYRESQNVFFTLLIGLLVISFDRWCRENPTLSPVLNTLLSLAALLSGAALAEFLCTDYGYIGVLAIDILYQLHRQRVTGGLLASAVLCLSSPIEVTAFFCVPLLYFYNGKRGLSLKYIFYVFYPAHLLLLFFLGKALF